VLRVNNSQLRRNGGQIYAVSGRRRRPMCRSHPAAAPRRPRFDRLATVHWTAAGPADPGSNGRATRG